MESEWIRYGNHVLGLGKSRLYLKSLGRKHPGGLRLLIAIASLDLPHQDSSAPGSYRHLVNKKRCTRLDEMLSLKVHDLLGPELQDWPTKNVEEFFVPSSTDQWSWANLSLTHHVDDVETIVKQSQTLPHCSCLLRASREWILELDKGDALGSLPTSWNLFKTTQLGSQRPWSDIERCISAIIPVNQLDEVDHVDLRLVLTNSLESWVCMNQPCAPLRRQDRTGSWKNLKIMKTNTSCITMERNGTRETTNIDTGTYYTQHSYQRSQGVKTSKIPFQAFKLQRLN